MLIDFEAHYALDDTFNLRNLAIKDNADEVSGTGAPAGPLEDISLSRIDRRLAAMDELGIDMQILSHSAGVESLEPQFALKIAQKVNNALYELTERYPGRFMGWAALPMRCPQEAAAELERCIRELGFFGWNVYSNFGIPQRLDDAMFAPVLETADRLAVPCYIHPPAPNMAEYQGGPPALWGGLGYTADALLTVIRMQLAGVYDRYPHIRFMLGHLGETLPFMMKRMSQDPGKVSGLSQHTIDWYMRHNFFVTTSGNYEEASLRCTLDVLGAERVLYGSDFPMEKAAEGVQFIRSAPITREERDAICFGNAAREFGLGR